MNKASLRRMLTQSALVGLSFGMFFFHQALAQDAPPVKSKAVLVLDQESSSVIYSRHADEAKPIASITKLMTALVVLEAHQNLDEVIEITAEDGIGAKTVTSRLIPGTRLTRSDLLHLALMSSENRAAHALARSYPGGFNACVQAMNAKAQALGMTQSQFEDPTGLSMNNVASPHDLAKLVEAASQVSLIREFSTDQRYVVRVGRREVEFRNTDSLVRNPTWNIVVQKTGYIEEAGRCLVMKTVMAGRSVVIVLLDSTGKYTRVADAQRVRKWLESHSLTSQSNQLGHRSERQG